MVNERHAGGSPYHALAALTTQFLNALCAQLSRINRIRFNPISIAFHSLLAFFSSIKRKFQHFGGHIGSGEVPRDLTGLL